MKKIVITVVVTGVILALFTGIATAAPSAGCLAINGAGGTANPSFNLTAQTFKKGETIELTVSSPGNSFELTNSGTPIAGPQAIDGTIIYPIPANGSYTFGALAAGPTDPTTTATFTCIPNPDEEEPTEPPSSGPVTLCHIPPGNPAAKHTITVGAPAVQAHLGHGDTLGACSEEEETRHDSEDGTVSIFTIIIIGIFEVYGDCVGEECSLVISINFNTINLSQPQNITIDDNPNDGWKVIIFFLHTDPDDPTVKVFQINVYHNDTLVNDDILLFVSSNGQIVSWTTHLIWLKRAQTAGIAS